MFKWGVSNELLPVEVYQAIATVPGIRHGKRDVEESEPVKPVADDVFEKTLPHLKPELADVLRFIRLTGCRPNEAYSMRPKEIDRQGEVWKYSPERHKNSTRGKKRVVMIGPQAQKIIKQYLSKDSRSYVFERQRQKPFTRYSVHSRICYACKKYQIEHWSPNQLRHAKATEIRSMFDLESASVLLGHSRLNTTEIYAEKNLSKAEQIALQVV